MHTLTLTIGRNVKGVEMGDLKWAQFKTATVEQLYVTQHDAAEQHEGMGFWNGEPERSFKVTILRELPWNNWEIVWVKKQARRLAAGYVQDAISLTVGESFLVEARTPLAERVSQPAGLGNGSARLGRLLTPGAGA